MMNGASTAWIVKGQIVPSRAKRLTIRYLSTGTEPPKTKHPKPRTGFRIQVYPMSLINKISEDMTTAMKARDQGRLAPLRMAKAALMNREVEKGRALDDTESQQVIASLIKQRRDSAEQFQKGGREELAARETAEIVTLEAYLPPPLDTAVVERAVDEAIKETGAASQKDMGRVMKAVMVKLAGLGADGRLISETVKRKLGA